MHLIPREYAGNQPLALNLRFHPALPDASHLAPESQAAPSGPPLSGRANLPVSPNIFSVSRCGKSITCVDFPSGWRALLRQCPDFFAFPLNFSGSDIIRLFPTHPNRLCSSNNQTQSAAPIFFPIFGARPEGPEKKIYPVPGGPKRTYADRKRSDDVEVESSRCDDRRPHPQLFFKPHYAGIRGNIRD
jgi:hypothetical protein